MEYQTEFISSPSAESQAARKSIRTPNLRGCATCGKSLAGKRPDAFYCSAHCYDTRKRFAGAKERSCKFCGTLFPLKDFSDANRKYCSKACAKRQYTKGIEEWRKKHPGHSKLYNANRLAKNPGAWVEESRRKRAKALELLGGKCVVPYCGATNPYWLHIDYIPTTKGAPYRHSRGVAYVRRNMHLFRILCANHHYELTLTGRIEGTEITQIGNAVPKNLAKALGQSAIRCL